MQRMQLAAVFIFVVIFRRANQLNRVSDNKSEACKYAHLSFAVN